MKTQEKLELIKQGCEEVLTDADLQFLLESGEQINHYMGMEISGKPHIGQCLILMQKFKELADAGVKIHFWLADWHTWINNKLGGNKKLIKEVAHGYFKEVFKASYKMLGGNPDDINFILASDFYEKRPDFWATMLEVSKNTTLARMQRTISIMGRGEGDKIDFSMLIYPPMQVADIFSLGMHIAHAGMDQRKVHVVARQVAKKIKTNPLIVAGKQVAPVMLHTPLLPGLKKPAIWPLPDDTNWEELSTKMKMSKSDPSSAMFVHDEPKSIKKKIMKGFCMEGEIRYNPILDWMRMIVFYREKDGITITRPDEHGGNISFDSYKSLKLGFAEKKVHPIDVKNFLSDYLIDLFAPAREHFSKPENKKMLDRMEEILMEVKNEK